MDTGRKLRCTRKSSSCEPPDPEPSFESVEKTVKVIVDDDGHTVTCNYGNTRNTQMMCNYPPKEESIEFPEPVGQPKPPYPNPVRPTPMPDPGPIGPGQTIPTPGPYPGIPTSPSPTLIPDLDEESNENSVTIIHNGGTTVYCSKRNLQVICNNLQAPNHFDKAVALSRGSQRFAGLSAIAASIGTAGMVEGVKWLFSNYGSLKEIGKDIYHAGKDAYNWLFDKKDQTEVKTHVMDCIKTGGHFRRLWRSMTRHQKDCTFGFDYDAVARSHGFAHCTLKPHACKAVKEIGQNVGGHGVPAPPPAPVYPSAPPAGSVVNNMVCNFRTKTGRNVIMACNYYNKYRKK